MSASTMATQLLMSRNRLLAALPDDERAKLAIDLARVRLVQGEVLFDPDERPNHVYFPLTGMISLVAPMNDGAAVEVATIGPEGAVNLIQGLGTGCVFWRAIVQIPGEALRIERARLQAIRAGSEAMRAVVGRYTEAFLVQILQLVACNALHAVEARLARWLLASRDCVGDDRLPLTQEFLAEMLGVNRTTVTQAARDLQRAKLIAYRRGQVRILDRAGLEHAACECQGRIRRGFDALLPPIVAVTCS